VRLLAAPLQKKPPFGGFSLNFKRQLSFWSHDNLTQVEARPLDCYIPPPRPVRDSLSEKMREKLRTEAGADLYRRRKVVVEPVFGQIKQARGFRQFLLRGLDQVRAEWAMVCTVHNLLKLHRAAA